MDEEKGEYCLKKRFPSRVNYYFFSEELYDLNMAARKKKADKLYREAVSLQADLDKGKKLKKRYQFGNDLIEARIYLQTKLTHMTEQEARDYIFERTVDGREGFLLSHIEFGPEPVCDQEDVPRQGLCGEAVLFDEVRHRYQAHSGLDR